MNMNLIFGIFVGVLIALIAPVGAVEVDHMDDIEIISFCDSETVRFLISNPTGGTGTVSLIGMLVSTQEGNVEIKNFILADGQMAEITVRNISLPIEISLSGEAIYSKPKLGWIGRLKGDEPRQVAVCEQLNAKLAVVSQQTYREDIDRESDFEISEVDFEIIDSPYIIRADRRFDSIPFFGNIYLKTIYVENSGTETHIFNPSNKEIIWNDIVIPKRSHLQVSYKDSNEVVLLEEEPVEVYYGGYNSINTREEEEVNNHMWYIYLGIILSIIIFAFMWLLDFIRRIF